MLVTFKIRLGWKFIYCHKMCIPLGNFTWKNRGVTKSCHNLLWCFICCMTWIATRGAFWPASPLKCWFFYHPLGRLRSIHRTKYYGCHLHCWARTLIREWFNFSLILFPLSDKNVFLNNNVALVQDHFCYFRSTWSWFCFWTCSIPNHRQRWLPCEL